MTTSTGTEALLVPWLAADVGQRVTTETPSDLQSQVPLHRLVVAGGPVDPNSSRFRNPRIVVTSFAAGYLAASDAAEGVKTSLLKHLPGQSINGSVINRVTCESLPTWTPYADTTIRQFVATYQLWLKTSS